MGNPQEQEEDSWNVPLRLEQPIISSAAPTGREGLEEELQSILGQTDLAAIEMKCGNYPLCSETK